MAQFVSAHSYGGKLTLLTNSSRLKNTVDNSSSLQLTALNSERNHILSHENATGSESEERTSRFQESGPPRPSFGTGPVGYTGCGRGWDTEARLSVPLCSIRSGSCPACGSGSTLGCPFMSDSLQRAQGEARMTGLADSLLGELAKTSGAENGPRGARCGGGGRGARSTARRATHSERKPSGLRSPFQTVGRPRWNVLALARGERHSS